MFGFIFGPPSYRNPILVYRHPRLRLPARSSGRVHPLAIDENPPDESYDGAEVELIQRLAQPHFEVLALCREPSNTTWYMILC